MRTVHLLLTLSLLAPTTLWSQEDALSVELTTDSEWIDRTAPLTMVLNRPLQPQDGRLAVLLDQTDLTDLFLFESTNLTYRPDVLPLPSGKHELVIFLVLPGGGWNEISRVAIQVRARGGIEERSARFSIDLQGVSQFDTDANPINDRADTGESATAQIQGQGMATLHGWTVESGMSLFATSEIEQALRFFEKGSKADQLDLAEYSLRISKGRNLLELGHVFFGQNRHLIDSFASRGIVLGSGLGRVGDIRAAALNGSSIVGWDNPSGLSRSEHRVLSAAAGFELLPNRPGALRIDLDYLDGSILPLNDFNQGGVNDAEENQGWAARLAGSTPGQRVSFRAGFARSDFLTPDDPFLSQGFDLVPVEAEQRSAQYLEIDLVLLEQLQLSEDWNLDLQLGLRHERVDPQYRTVAAFVQADQEQNGADLSATLGPVSLQTGHSRSEDNLDDIESILKTKTRSSQLNLGLPLGMIFDGKPRPWLPALNYSVQRTAQRAEDQPVNSGFNATSHLPDQVSLNHTASLDWQPNRWQLGLQWNLSEQDNRQEGRQFDDFENTSLGLRLSAAAHQRLDLGMELTKDEAKSLANDITERTDHLGLDVLWRPLDALSVTARYSLDDTENAPRTATSKSTIFNLELSYRTQWGADMKHGGSAQWFLRYATQDFEAEDQIFAFRTVRDSHTIRAGLNLSIR